MSNLSDNISVISDNFSEAGSEAAVVLWSPSCSKKEKGGQFYIEKKNTFLEFYTDEQKQTKGNARPRSFSHDGVFAGLDSRSTKKGDNSLPSLPSTPSVVSGSSFSSLDTNSQPDSHHDDGTITPASEVDHGNMPFRSLVDLNSRLRWCDTSEGLEDNDAPETWMPEAAIQFIPFVAHVPMFNARTPVQEPSSSKSNKKGQTGIKKKSELKSELTPLDYSGITTLMIRGIPCKFSEKEIRHLLDSSGLGDKYDFFYMPYAGKNGSNLGYAFVNFIKTLDAWTCAFTFNGIQLDPARSAKICSVSPADIQGIANLRKHFRCSLVSQGPHAPKFVPNNKRKKQNKGVHEEEQGSVV